MYVWEGEKNHKCEVVDVFDLNLQSQCSNFCLLPEWWKWKAYSKKSNRQLNNWPVESEEHWWTGHGGCVRGCVFMCRPYVSTLMWLEEWLTCVLIWLSQKWTILRLLSNRIGWSRRQCERRMTGTHLIAEHNTLKERENAPRRFWHPVVNRESAVFLLAFTQLSLLSSQLFRFPFVISTFC